MLRTKFCRSEMKGVNGCNTECIKRLAVSTNPHLVQQTRQTRVPVQNGCTVEFPTRHCHVT